MITFEMQKNILSKLRIFWFIKWLDTFSKRKHKTKCYKECSDNKYNCFSRSCFCFSNCRSNWHSLWSNCCWISCRWESICNTLIMNLSWSFSTSYINNVGNDWIFNHSNEITIFTICLIKSISSTKICFNKFYFLTSTKNILELRRTWLSWSPDNITTIFPYFCYITRTSWPFCYSKCNHIWIFLFTLICYHEWSSIIRPIVKKSRKFFPYSYRTSIKTLITAICSECCIRRTINWLILTECCRYCCWCCNRSYSACCIKRNWLCLFSSCNRLYLWLLHHWRCSITSSGCKCHRCRKSCNNKKWENLFHKWIIIRM